MVGEPTKSGSSARNPAKYIDSLMVGIVGGEM